MAPAPSPNACGLAAYRQLAGNLRIDDIQHGYWTSRKGNAARFEMWAERRKHAAPWLRSIAKRHGTANAVRLDRAAAALERDAKLLAELSALLPRGGDEKAHWDESNMAKAEELLAKAETLHGLALAELDAVAGFSPLATKDPAALQKIVVEGDYVDALAALDALVRLAPKDLDRRLADLFASCPDERKELADGPIHRQLIFALEKHDSDVATEAIGKAVSFPGLSDAVKPAISKWAAEMYWARKGKEGNEVFVKALDSKVGHVVEHGLKYCGMTGDESLLPRIKEFDLPAAWIARVVLGDESAYPKLFEGLGGPAWRKSYFPLRELGAQVEKHAFPFLENENEQTAVYTAILLSRVGTKASVEPLKKTIERLPENGRLKQALADLEKRLAGE